MVGCSIFLSLGSVTENILVASPTCLAFRFWLSTLYPGGRPSVLVMRVILCRIAEELAKIENFKFGSGGNSLWGRGQEESANSLRSGWTRLKEIEYTTWCHRGSSASFVDVVQKFDEFWFSKENIVEEADQRRIMYALKFFTGTGIHWKRSIHIARDRTRLRNIKPRPGRSPMFRILYVCLTASRVPVRNTLDHIQISTVEHGSSEKWLIRLPW